MMKRIVLCAGVLICAAALFSGCVPVYYRDYSRVDIGIDWRVDPDHEGYYIPSDHHHHGDRYHPVYKYTPVWRVDDDHPGYYIPRDHGKHGDKHHHIYKEDHQGAPDDHKGGKHHENRDDSQGRDNGERAIRQYCAQHALPVHISSIEQLTDETQPGITAQSPRRYMVIDAAAGTETVVVYNPVTSGLALE